MASDPEKGMIDLGRDMSEVVGKPSNPADRTDYPSLHISDVDELHDLPDGEFYAMVKCQVTRHEDSAPVDGDEHCSCDIAIMGFKVVGQPKVSKKPAPDAEERLGDAFDSIAKKKADDAEDAQDDGADEDTEE